MLFQFAVSSLILILILLVIWRNYGQRKAELAFKYRLYTLRDQLRKEAISGKIDSKDWKFSYYDKSISKAVSNAYSITLFSIVLHWMKYNDNEEFMKFYHRLEGEVKEDPFYSELKKELNEATLEYIMGQHDVSFRVFFKPLLTALFGFKVIQKKFLRSINSVFYLPEISDSPNHIKLAA